MIQSKKMNEIFSNRKLVNQPSIEDVTQKDSNRLTLRQVLNLERSSVRMDRDELSALDPTLSRSFVRTSR